MRKIGQLLSLIKYSPQTSKVSKLSSFRKVFVFDRSLSKLEIKQLMQHIFHAKIRSVNTCTLPPKVRHIRKHAGIRPSFKKAYILLESLNNNKD